MSPQILDDAIQEAVLRYRPKHDFGWLLLDCMKLKSVRAPDYRVRKTDYVKKGYSKNTIIQYDEKFHAVAVEPRENMIFFVDIFEGLKEKDAAILRLKYLKGLRDDEIGAVFDMTANGVSMKCKRLCARILKRLKTTDYEYSFL